MLGTLLKKQFLSLICKTGSSSGKNDKRGIITYIAIIAVAAIAGGASFYFIAEKFASALVAFGLDWVYFAYAGMIALAMAIVVSVFMTQSQLYEAKDNELLLAMPIPPRHILFCRMLPLYVQNMIFCAIVLVPAFIAYGVVTSVTAVQAMIWVLVILTMPMLTLFITCILGFIVALITLRLRDKTLVTVIVSIVFIIAYFILYAQIMGNVEALIADSEAIASGIKKGFYPLYTFGAALCGGFGDFMIILGVSAALFAVMYLVLSLTYIKFITTRHGGSKAKYNGKVGKASSPAAALLRKETKRFVGTGIYMLNCGLGVLLLLGGTVFFAIKYSDIAEVMTIAPVLAAQLPTIACALIATVSAMDAVTAPSISLEGKSLWLLQSLPIDMWQVIKAKLILHYLVTAPAATLCSVVFAILVRPSAGMIALLVISPSVVVTLSGVIGLMFNIKKPVLKWENETFVIKQSMSAVFTMLACIAAVGVCVLVYVFIHEYLAPEIYLMICLILMTGADVGLLVWLKKRGTVILQNL